MSDEKEIKNLNNLTQVDFKTKQGEDKSDLLAGECSYQPEWLDQKEWVKHLCEEYIKVFKPELADSQAGYGLDIFATRLVYQKGDNFKKVTPSKK